MNNHNSTKNQKPPFPWLTLLIAVISLILLLIILSTSASTKRIVEDLAQQFDSFTHSPLEQSSTESTESESDEPAYETDPTESETSEPETTQPETPSLEEQDISLTFLIDRTDKRTKDYNLGEYQTDSVPIITMKKELMASDYTIIGQFSITEESTSGQADADETDPEADNGNAEENQSDSSGTSTAAESAEIKVNLSYSEDSQTGNTIITASYDFTNPSLLGSYDGHEIEWYWRPAGQGNWKELVSEDFQDGSIEFESIDKGQKITLSPDLTAEPFNGAMEIELLCKIIRQNKAGGSATIEIGIIPLVMKQ